GLSLSSAGVISGTPSAAGTASVVVTVTDHAGTTASATLSLDVVAATSALAITTSSLPSGTVSSVYSTTLAASGGVSPYAWSLGSGSSLPSGLSLSSAGVISGTPSAAATGSVVVTVTDHAGTTASATLSLDVVAVSALTILTTELPDGTPYSGQAGDPYSADLVASGGSGSYAWSLASGSVIPTGLALSSSGVISGTTVGFGPHLFTVVVTDTASPGSTASQALVIYGVYQNSSQNWSGYVITPGPFTGASGTFTVPNIAPTTSSSGTYTSIWVGIDGDGNTDLIQAGVQLQDFAGGTVQIFPWWEILPAMETPISSMGTVSVGDQITVDIAQLSEATSSTSGSWSITVTDDTTGQSFTTTQAYTGGYTGSAYGEGATAEWIVERPQVNGAYSTLGTYSPTVDFTNLGYSGSTAVGWQDMALSYQPVVGQPYVTVSSPSSIDPLGFDVAYGATAPSEPA
ncbi:MAG: G1 family glutamic endopeptidase, partial [Acidimicrobiales bacterium]